MSKTRDIIYFFLLVFGGIIANASAAVFAQEESQYNQGESQYHYAYFFVVDRSPSMGFSMPGTNQSKIDTLKKQIQLFSDYTYNDALIRIYSFSTDVEEIITTTLDEPEKRFELANAVQKIQASRTNGDYTRMWRALKHASEEAQRMLDENPNLRKIKLVLFSDGEDNDPNPPADIGLSGSDSEKLLRLEPVFVSINAKLSDSFVDELEGKGVRTTEVKKPDDLLLLDPILSYYPSKVEAEQPIWLVSLSNGKINRTEIEIDGQTYSAREVATSFSSPGEHNVKLTVYGANNRVETNTFTIDVAEKTPLKAAFHISKSEISVGESVTFINESTGGVKKAHWSFSDKTSSNDLHATKTFDQPGTYSVTLTVSDEKGAKDKLDLLDAVVVTAPVPPKAEIRVSPATPTVGDIVTFFDASTGSVSSRQWLVDGKSVGTDPILNYTFSKSSKEDHDVKLVVTGPFGETNSTNQTIKVKPIPKPKADFVLSPELPIIHKPFKAFYIGQGGAATAFRWTVNGQDVSPSNNQEALKSYNLEDVVIDEPGECSIALFVQGPGGEDVYEKKFEIRPVPPPVPGFAAPEEVAVDSQIKLVDASQNSEETTYLIGEKPIEDQSNSPTVTFKSIEDKSASPTLTFTKPGVYAIKQVCKNEGGETPFEREIIVKPYAPPRVRVVAPSELKAKTPATFAVSIVGDVQSGSINFGDGDTPLDFSSLDAETLASNNVSLEVQHTFPKAGDYTVSCAVEGRGGKATSEPLAVHVKTLRSPPKADFEVIPNKNYGTVLLRVINNSLGDGPFTFDIVKNGRTVETVRFDQRQGFERTIKGPGLVEIKLAAESGDEFSPSRTERSLRIKALSTAAVVLLCLGGLLLVAAIVAVIIWYNSQRVYALQCVLEYRTNGEEEWHEIVIAKRIARQARVTITRTVPNAAEDEDDEQETQTTLTVSKAYLEENVSYTLSRHDTGDVDIFERDSEPTQNSPLTLGDLYIAFHEL